VTHGDINDPRSEEISKNNERCLFPPSYTSSYDGWEVQKPDESEINVKLFFAPPNSTPEDPKSSIVDVINSLSMTILPRRNGSLPFLNLYTHPTVEQKTNGWTYGKRVRWFVRDPSEIHITKNPNEQTPYQLLTYVTPIDPSNNPHDPSEKQQKSTVTYGIPLVMMSLESCLYYSDTPEKGEMASLEPDDQVKYITIETDPRVKMEEINFVLSNFTCGSKNGSFQKNMDSKNVLRIRRF
jgi:hypothetical protein